MACFAIAPNTVIPLAAASTATIAKQNTAQADLDLLTGVDGVTLATAQANYAPAKAGDAMAVSDKTGFSLSAAGILAIWDRLTSGFLLVGSIGKLIKDFLDGSISSRASSASTATLVNQTSIINTLGTPSGASVSADIAEIKTFLDTEIADILLDTSTTLDGKLNAIKAKTDQFVFTLANKVDSNMIAVNGSTEAADDMRTAAETMVKGSAVTGTLSTTEMTTNLVVSVAGQYNGAVLIFAKDTATAALRGQRTDITATTVLSGKIGFTSLTTAPVNGDTFVIV